MSSAALQHAVATDLEAAWRRSDALFGMIAPEAMTTRPIPLRQPFIFYMGHLPAFAWNHVGRRILGRPAFRPDLDELFERGIDPVDTQDGVGGDEAGWPPVAEVVAYRDRVREALRPLLEDERLAKTLAMVLEHELMHHETLLYMMLRLPHAAKRPPAGLPPFVFEGAIASREVRVDAGRAHLGAERGALPFVWDNELDAHEVSVPGFSMDATPVRNAELLAFVEAGGYDQHALWSDEAWSWLQRRGQRHPLCWSRERDGWMYRTLFADVPLERAADWPVFVTWAEAQAYTRFIGRRLLTEAEFHRAAIGAAPGNAGLRHWSPTPVGSDPGGTSAWGVHDLVGNGWEWTGTAFAPFRGFTPLPGYPGYSADFFDGRHYVLLGGSWATDERLLRPSFRNWFQPHYPYVFAQFRTVAGSR
jgi:ergothioneine biosynthesis protein EgtB